MDFWAAGDQYLYHLPGFPCRLITSSPKMGGLNRIRGYRLSPFKYRARNVWVSPCRFAESIMNSCIFTYWLASPPSHLSFTSSQAFVSSITLSNPRPAICSMVFSTKASSSYAGR